MQRISYNLITFPLSLLAGGIALISKRGRRRYGERFGIWSKLDGSYIWFHAASVGEANGLIPLLNELKRTLIGKKILITATSPTGLDRLRDYGDELRLLPFDNWIWINRALGNLKIEALIISETELWPELIWNVKARHAPVALINASISDSSWRWYRCSLFFWKDLFKSLDLALLALNTSLIKFKRLGLDEGKLEITGNTKYDHQPKIDVSESRALRKQLFISDNPTLVLGSIREGEEEFWFESLVPFIGQGKLNLVVAPRHPKSASYFQNKLTELGVFSRLFSNFTASASPAEASPLILDQLGKLEAMYAIADLAFVGGSCVDFGGHNPLEPAMYAVPVVMGPFVSNVEDVVVALERVGGVARVFNADDTRAIVSDLCLKHDTFADMGVKAHGVWKEFCGASKRTLESLRRFKILK